MNSSKPLGRPPKAQHDKRTLQINFKVTEAELDRIRDAAGRYPVATWVRGLVLDHLDARRGGAS